MAEIARWGERVFAIGRREIATFEALALTISVETAEKSQGTEGYAAFKKVKPRQITQEILLSRALGNDVRGEIDLWNQAAAKGESHDFYVGGAKLTPCPFLLTSVAVKEINVGRGGVIGGAKLSLTFMQADISEGTKKKATTSGSKKAGELTLPETPKLGLLSGLMAGIKTAAQQIQEKSEAQKVIDQQEQLLAAQRQQTLEKELEKQPRVPKGAEGDGFVSLVN